MVGIDTILLAPPVARLAAYAPSVPVESRRDPPPNTARERRRLPALSRLRLRGAAGPGPAAPYLAQEFAQRTRASGAAVNAAAAAYARVQPQTGDRLLGLQRHVDISL